MRLPSAEETALAREQTEGLHQEIDRLPKAFRVAVVLRYFEGQTIDEIAGRLNWPVGTVRSRLARAREKLRMALGRRGLALPVVALASGASSQHWTSASVSSRLCDTTTVAAMNFVAGRVGNECVAGVATSLARKVLQTMLLRRMAVVAFALLLSGALVGAGSYLTCALARTSPPERSPVIQQARVQAVPKTDGDPPAPGRMFIHGRVLDPRGKPVAGATILAYARGKIRRRFLVVLSPAAIGETRSDESGRFRLDAARTGSSQHESAGAIATAPGFGAAWVELDPDDEKPQADITLLPEQVIQGRLFDVQGRPVPGVELVVSAMSRGGQSIRELRQDGSDGLQSGSTRGKTLPGWPQPATTDAGGRFTVRGVGRGFRVTLKIDDPRFALQSVEVDADGAAGPKPLTATLVPAQFVSGRITYADSGKAARGARIVVHSSIAPGRAIVPLEVRTDTEGRFHANTSPSDSYEVTAYPPPGGQPYLSLSQEFDWPKGAVEHSIDLRYPGALASLARLSRKDQANRLRGQASVSCLGHSDNGEQTAEARIPIRLSTVRFNWPHYRAPATSS